MATKFYDPALASGANNGSSWEDAYRTIQAAIDGCGAGDEVWGKEGTETLSVNIDIDNANAPSIYGGFSSALTGTSGSVAGRDLTTDITRLDGNLTATAVEVTVNSIIDGFEFFEFGSISPAGIHINNNALDLTIRNCKFTDNVGDFYGGGLYVEAANSVTVEDSIFSGCCGGYGMISVRSAAGDTFTMNRCTVTECSATYNGAAIRASTDASIYLNDCIFSNNTIASTSVYGTGAVVYCYNPNVAEVYRCRFTGNTGDSDSWGGGLNLDTVAAAKVVNCVFSGNTGCGYGGGLLVSTSTVSVVNCIFSANSAASGGGAIRNRTSGVLTVTNCILWENHVGANNDNISHAGTSIAVTYTDIQGGYTGTGNVDDDPHFLGSGSNPYNFGTTTSSAIDSGNAGATNYPTTDILGQARVDYSTVTNTGAGSPAYSDMGAYEMQEAVAVTTAKLLLLFN